jgi:NADPH-dependent ferric siderophore reductase
MSQNQTGSHAHAIPIIEKKRLEPVGRDLVVKEVERIGSRTLRVTLAGEELAGFNSPSPDDHIKVSFPTPEGGVEKRDYTPRRFDAKTLSLSIDFALHKGGVGAEWAEKAKPGDHLRIGGPRGSTTISAPGAWWLLIGDETALPSIGRRLEELAEGTRAISVVAVVDAEEEQKFRTKANHTAHWIHRPDTQAADAEPFLNLLSKLELPSGPGFIWVAGEGAVARAVRTYFVDTLKHPPEWIKAAAYWSQNPEEQE